MDFVLCMLNQKLEVFPHTDHLDLLPWRPHSKIFVAYTSQPPNYYTFFLVILNNSILHSLPLFVTFSIASFLLHYIFFIAFVFFISSIQLIISSVYTVFFCLYSVSLLIQFSSAYTVSLTLVFHQHFHSSMILFIQTTSTGSIFSS